MSIEFCGEFKGWCKSFTKLESVLIVLAAILIVVFLSSLIFLILHFMNCPLRFEDNLQLFGAQKTQNTHKTIGHKAVVTRSRSILFSTATTFFYNTLVSNGITVPQEACTSKIYKKTTPITHYRGNVTEKTTSNTFVESATYSPNHTSLLTKTDKCITMVDHFKPYTYTDKRSLVIALIKLISFQDLKFGCTLTIISEQWTITSASCIKFIRKKNDLKSFVMMENIEEPYLRRSHTVASVLLHPQYHTNNSYDIAVLKTDDKFGRHVAVLADFIESFMVTIGERMTSVAYERLRMREARVWRLPPRHCNIKGTGKLCAGKGRRRAVQCAGAALLQGAVLHGVASGGRCRTTRRPRLYVGVAAVRGWILQVLQEDVS